MFIGDKNDLGKPNAVKLCISGRLDYFIRNYWRLWMAHLAQVSISQAKYYKNLICDSTYLKLELDAFVFSLPLNRTFSCSFGRYGYSGLCPHLASLPKNESGFVAYDALSVMDSICNLLKFLHMAV